MTDSDSLKAPAPGEICREWWRKYIAENSDRAVAAKLRRANSRLEILQVPESLWLIQKLPPRVRKDSAATVAGVLAHIRTDAPALSAARRIGRRQLNQEESAVVSESRFRRLLQTPQSDLLDPMRRIVTMADNQINVSDVATAVLYWNDRTKERWILQYYAVYDTTSAAAAEGSISHPQNQPTE